MRLWSIHPKYLDVKGLTALWREGLLARKVLQGKTKGYRNHPQLIRFKTQKNPLRMIDAYLADVYQEALRRGYSYDGTKIKNIKIKRKMPVNSGQIDFEIMHLKNKLKKRSPESLKFIPKKIKLNSVFFRKNGDVERWEKV